MLKLKKKKKKQQQQKKKVKLTPVILATWEAEMSRVMV
jgi:hypothetical protein